MKKRTAPHSYFISTRYVASHGSNFVCFLKKKWLDRWGSIPQPAVYEFSVLPLNCPNLLLLEWNGVMIKSGGWNRGDWKIGSAAGIKFSVTELIRKGSMSQKACRNLPGVWMRLQVREIWGRCMQKCERDVWTHKHTDRSTDQLVLVIDYKTTVADL